MRAIILQLTLAGMALVLASCSKRPGQIAMRHDYSAPHGGTIVRLGKEEYHLEFVRNAAAGKLTAYVLDAQSKTAVPVRPQPFELTATAGTEKWPLAFEPAAALAPGDTAQFEAEATWLKTTARFDAELARLKVGSTTFLHVRFSFPEGNEKR